MDFIYRNQSTPKILYTCIYRHVHRTRTYTPFPWKEAYEYRVWFRFVATPSANARSNIHSHLMSSINYFLHNCMDIIIWTRSLARKGSADIVILVLNAAPERRWESEKTRVISTINRNARWTCRWRIGELASRASERRTGIFQIDDIIYSMNKSHLH